MAHIISKTITVLIVILSLVLDAGMALAGNGPVVLDAGHGGYDMGIISSGVREKEITLNIAKSVKARLEGIDEHKVWLSRKIDQYVSIVERRAEANSVGPGMFISLHLSGGDKLAIYITWYLRDDTKLKLDEYYDISSAQRRYLYESKVLSRSMGKSISGVLEVPVAYREMPLELLNSIGSPAVMIELPSMGIDYEESAGLIVNAIVAGIEDYERGR